MHKKPRLAELTATNATMEANKMGQNRLQASATMVCGQALSGTAPGQGNNQNSTRLLIVANPQPSHINPKLLPTPAAARCNHKKRQTSSMVATAPALISAGRYGAGANSKFSGLSNSFRSEERRVGKECRSRGWSYHE